MQNGKQINLETSKRNVRMARIKFVYHKHVRNFCFSLLALALVCEQIILL